MPLPFVHIKKRASPEAIPLITGQNGTSYNERRNNITIREKGVNPWLKNRI